VADTHEPRLPAKEGKGELLNRHPVNEAAQAHAAENGVSGSTRFEVATAKDYPVAATPAKTLEATSNVASPAPRNQPTVPTFSAAEIAGHLAHGDWLTGASRRRDSGGGPARSDGWRAQLDEAAHYDHACG
jgi:hypothetical protein